MFRNASERVQSPGGQVRVISDDPIVLVGGMSRSGTTLVTAVLDAHPEIACGAELLPPRFACLASVLDSLDSALETVGGDFSGVGKHLRQRGERELGLFLTRCYRAGVAQEEVRQVLTSLADSTAGSVDSLGERLEVAQALMRLRSDREGTTMYGFKYTSSATEACQGYLPNSVLLCIIRDPRDVVLSHQKRGFDRSVEEVCVSWNAYTNAYRRYAEKHPERCHVIRYEDLVRQPRRTLENSFAIMSVDFHPDVLEFHRSESPIHGGFHPNAERLRMSFSTDGIGCARKELPVDTLQQIESLCRNEMQANGYDNCGYIRRRSISRLRKENHISGFERAKHRVRLARKRKFTEDDYHKLLEPYIGEYEIMAMADYVRETEVGDRNILMIRHDVDHDLENAIKIAKWEADRGIRATYCLLHTAWYYGLFENGRYQHSDFLIEGIEAISELGHEINFHNNLVVLALREGVDPIGLLESELRFYDALGVPITGTSTHGDALCRELNFRNWELFKECCDDRFGGPRILEYTSGGDVRHCELGKYSMADLGLEYEAYDIAKDYYHTESGGIMRLRENTRGRRAFGRAENSRGRVVGILTHPVWWSFNVVR